MLELFQCGGLLFMSILTIQLVIVLLMSGRYAMKAEKRSADLDLVRSVGLLAAISGVFAQLTGLFAAFRSIEMAGSVSPAVLAGGLRISFITTIYGLLIFALALVLWSFLRTRTISAA